MALCALLLLGAARAVAPHLSRTLDAVDRERAEVPLDLRPGAQRTDVFDVHGRPIGVLRYDVDRELTRLGDVPTDVIATLLASEDAKFWRHTGVDLRATVRALVSNVSAGSISSGGSTITQQIVKLRVVGNERSFNRKIREAVLATRLEEQFTKSEILEFYVNEIFLGNGAYGLQAAAETYFGKDVSELDVGDMAFLAGLIRSPSIYDGFDKNADVVTRRRSSALARAEAEGVITAAERAAFERRPLPKENLSPQRTDVRLRRDYFLDEVTTALLGLPELGDTHDERFARVFNGGLRVWTTLVPELKEQMDAAVAEVLPEPSAEGFEVAMATVDPSTGAILAMVGGPEFTDLQFNLATQGMRQPGSSFKAYVLATAVEAAGLIPHDTISGLAPCTFANPPQADYVVHNFGNSAGRVASLRRQTLASSNCAFVRLGILTGIDRVADTASRLVGRDGDDVFDPYLSLSLGAQEVTVLEQAAAYATFANDGVRMEPYYITRIEDRDGNLLYEHAPQGRRVVSPRTAEWVTATLHANIESGTGTRAQLADGRPAAGKTGTAQDFTDAWFVGFTPQYSTAVWMGHPDEKVPMRDVQGRRGTGGWIPARIWGAYMSAALADEPVRPLPSAPAANRGPRHLFLEDDQCVIELDVGAPPAAPDAASPEEAAPAAAEPLRFDQPCSMVRLDNASDALVPLPTALCEVPVATSFGLTRNQLIRCIDVGPEHAALIRAQAAAEAAEAAAADSSTG
ncbi:MAG TPA: hypothetical protein DEP66_01610 [Acidimicrobiaceae bacterium]|nr:hypothetical protein [Acidimicrobiaceae bacterium]